LQNVDYQRAVGDGDEDVPASSPPVAAARKKKRRPRNSDEESDFGSAAPESDKDDESEPTGLVDPNELQLPKQKQSAGGILKGKSHQVYVSGKVPGQKHGKGKRHRVILPWERQNQVVSSVKGAGLSSSKTKAAPMSKTSMIESKEPVIGKRNPTKKRKTVDSFTGQMIGQRLDSSSKNPLQKGPNSQSHNRPTKVKADMNMKNHANIPQETSKTHPQSQTKDSQDTEDSRRLVETTPTPTSKRTTQHKATSPTVFLSKGTEDVTLSRESRLDTATPVGAHT